MSYKSISLNGTWDMFYSEEKYLGNDAPGNFKWANADYPDINYFSVPDAVPGYWEDMTDKFSYTPFYGDLKVTPDFGFMKSPMVMCGPDTVLPNIYGTFYYRRTFEFDGSKGDKTIHFEGVQNTAKVWINGEFLGEHIGYSTPFEFSISDDLLVKGENTIHMVVSNYKLLGYEENPIVGCTSRATTESTGGVTGDVEIRVYSSPLRDVAFIVSKDCKSVYADVEATADFKGEWKIYDKGTVIKEGSCEGSFEFDTDGMELWSPESPKLYLMEISTKGGKITRKFGVRRLVADGVHFKLNGYPYYLRGLCEHGYFAETMHPDHDSVYYRKEIKAVKNVGFNYIRMHTFVPEEEFLDAADELGILMHVESPNNTTVEEWKEIVKFARRHTSVVIYCSGNELLLDDPFIEHLHKCADVVHAETDSLYSPMSALRGVEYWFFEGFDPGIEQQLVEKPFKHNPRRLNELSKFSDMYNSYSLGHLSYRSTDCDSEFVDSIGEVYGKPRSTHEMGIIGAYLDLRLKSRYEGSRLEYARIHQSVEDHMRDMGVFDKFPVYFRNSVELQRRIRKQCYERCRMIESMAGYDYLGAIDHMNHNNSYCGGIMNEFFEIKETDSLRDILMYNSESVLLCDINKDVNFIAGETLKTAIFTSYYAKENLSGGILNITLSLDRKVIDRKRITLEEIETGKVSKLCDYEFKLPLVKKPGAMKLYVHLEGAEQFIENEWELYIFPQPEAVEKSDLVIVNDITEEELISAMKKGKKVLLLGSGPFAALPTKFINSRPGRPHDDLASIIYDHPIFKNMPHEGFCGWQFNKMLDGGTAVCFINDSVPFEPVLEMATSYKYIIRRAAIFEYNIFNGKLLVCGLNFDEKDPASNWLKAEIIKYASSDEFDPMVTLTDREFEDLLTGRLVTTPIYNSFALNTNDKSSTRKKRK